MEKMVMAGGGKLPPPPPLVGKSSIPQAQGIPADYAAKIVQHNADMEIAPPDVRDLPKIEHSRGETIGRIEADEVGDEFVLYLMENKAIPHFDFDLEEPVLGIIEAVPSLSDEEFEKFILGLANVDELFIFIEPHDMNKGEEGLFDWSLGKSKEPSWRPLYKKVTDSRRDVVIACYCNLWQRRAQSMGVTFPISDAIDAALKWKPNFHVQ